MLAGPGPSAPICRSASVGQRPISVTLAGVGVGAEHLAGRNVRVVPELPSGTVTFLFTDIEGSTRLWEERPDEMRAALAQHDEILRSAIEGNHGYVFATGG